MDLPVPTPLSTNSARFAPEQRDFAWLEKRLKEKYPHASEEDVRAAIKMAMVSEEVLAPRDRG